MSFGRLDEKRGVVEQTPKEETPTPAEKPKKEKAKKGAA